jgi:ankyrin repeat protein
MFPPGLTALHAASMSKQIDIVQALLEVPAEQTIQIRS